MQWKERITQAALLGTAAVVTVVTVKAAVTEEEAQTLIGSETPLERSTRLAIGTFMLIIGSNLEHAPFVTPQFGKEVGGTFTYWGRNIQQGRPSNWEPEETSDN